MVGLRKVTPKSYDNLSPFSKYFAIESRSPFTRGGIAYYALRTIIFVVREFGIQCSSERIKFPNIRTNRYYLGEDFAKKTKILESLYEEKVFGRRFFLVVRMFICSGEDLFVRLFCFCLHQ